MNHIRHLEELLGMLHEERYRCQQEDEGSAALNAVWNRIHRYESELEELKVAHELARIGKSRG
jgi:hypothetical protein